MLTVAHLTEGDIVEIAAPFAAIGWNKPAEQYRRYLAQCQSGERSVLVARSDGTFAGYGTLVWQSDHAPFRNAAIPEIVDLNVLPRLQGGGIGSRLMDELERLAGERSRAVGIGVGLTQDYGPAQRLYVLRGYVPDGRGGSAGGKQLQWGDTVLADDSLVLHLTKTLSG